MKDFGQMQFHPVSERLVKILCDKTRNSSPNFFRVLVAYKMAQVASMMRCSIFSPDQGPIPINMYAINLAPSGFGKGLSTNILEEQVFNQFSEIFTDMTFPLCSENNIAKLAKNRAKRNGTDEEVEITKLQKEFELCGELLFSFDSATPAAVKQYRHKLLLASAGSLNLEIDEIGSNLLNNVDVMTTFLELYDKGKIKQKLVKNTAENVRTSDVPGTTPTNAMLFGTPSKLLDGGRTEAELISMFDTGYARRCIFGYIRSITAKEQLTPQEILDMQKDNTSTQFLTDLSDRMGDLADFSNMNKVLSIADAEQLLLIEYKLHCEREADALPEHEEIRKAEVTHRYFKTLKLAGAYAFIDGSSSITADHIENAIKLVEESGESFKQLLTRERPYVKLARYLAEMDRDVTHADLVEDLPYMPNAESKRKELITMATAWGNQNGIIIKRSYSDGIEFIRGEKIKETDIERLKLSFSGDIANGYVNKTIAWQNMGNFVTKKGLHWCNHHFIGGDSQAGANRREDNAIVGFNMVVIDIDEGTSLETAKLLLAKHKCLIHTSKSHRKEKNGVMQGDRFRIIFPISHEVKLDASEFKQFMKNFYEWLPFNGDEVTNQRARKWETYSDSDSEIWVNEGEIIDALQFIPKTSKNDQRVSEMGKLKDLNALERWFLQNTGSGNRSNNLLRYGKVLVDDGKNMYEVQTAITALNDKIQDPLDPSEIASTIMATLGKDIIERDSKGS